MNIRHSILGFCVTVLFGCAVLPALATPTSGFNYSPPIGRVSDAAAAIHIAKAESASHYGFASVTGRTFSAALRGNTWVVFGYPLSPAAGDVIIVPISRTRGAVGTVSTAIVAARREVTLGPTGVDAVMRLRHQWDMSLGHDGSDR